MDLEQPDFQFTLPADRRARVPVPPAVQLLAVADVTMDVAPGKAKPVAEMFVALLQFEVESRDETQIVLRSGNARLIVREFKQAKPREDLMPLRLVVPSLASLRMRLGEMRIEYSYQRGITPGQRQVVFQDPAGGFVEVSESRQIG